MVQLAQDLVFRTMQSKVVITAGQVNIVFIRTPFDLHTKQFTIEPFRRFEFVYKQSDVPQTVSFSRSIHPQNQ